MTDQDYIRKAVELADGWDEKRHYLLESKYGVGDDALAAQLVRQVDAISETVWPEVIVYHDVTKIHNGSTMKWVVIGPDRTMNTIKAIVDSKVLE